MKIVITALIKIKIVHLEDLNVASAMWPPGVICYMRRFAFIVQQGQLAAIVNDLV